MKLFNKFPFADKPNTATFTCVHVINKEKPILYVIHDEDGFWQFLCGDNHSDEEARIVSLEEIYKIDKSIERLVNLDYGQSAYRKDKTSDWIKG